MMPLLMLTDHDSDNFNDKSHDDEEPVQGEDLTGVFGLDEVGFTTWSQTSRVVCPNFGDVVRVGLQANVNAFAHVAFNPENNYGTEYQRRYRFGSRQLDFRAMCGFLTHVALNSEND